MSAPSMAVRVEVGQVWRSGGPCGWVRVEAIELPDHPGYDGGAPGIVVRYRECDGRWGNTMFWLARDDAHALHLLQSHNYPRTPVEP